MLLIPISAVFILLFYFVYEYLVNMMVIRNLIFYDVYLMFALIFYDVYLMFALITSRILHLDYVRNNVHVCCRPTTVLIYFVNNAIPQTFFSTDITHRS